jgi:uncharacterized protein (DUF934 family)
MKPARKGKGMETTVLAECVACGQQREIKAGEVAQDDHPCCNRCGFPMIAVKAERKPRR